jgi:RNA polymerase sigma-70 factor (ECF subfamily)
MAAAIRPRAPASLSEAQMEAPPELPGPEAAIELMRRVAAGDAEAEAALAKLAIERVRQRARALTASEADADDATQTSMLQILGSAQTFRGEGSLLAWCDRIAVRTTLRLRKRQARRLALIDDLADPDRVDTSERVRKLAEEIPGHVSIFLAELSPERLEALELRARGHGIEEIAHRTGVSPNTVKDRLRTARKQLRQSIRQRELVAVARRSKA